MSTNSYTWVRRLAMGLLPLCLFVLMPFKGSAQCGTENTAFQSGEFLSYDLYFNEQKDSFRNFVQGDAHYIICRIDLWRSRLHFADSGIKESF